ncbi:MAG: DUF177 domain-containing protein [Acidimicrobiales bacterium]|nr:DUF177 domain-containing protein [Acidimicrobiales bacterium]
MSAEAALLVSVTDVRRRLGTRKTVERSLEARSLELSDVAVPDGASITFRGEVESISEGIVLTGTAEVPWSGACRRCLRDVDGVATVEIREIYETRPTDGETWPLVDDHIDLAPLLRDTALLALPLAPICSDECEGPDPDRFPTGPADDGDEAQEGPPVDPRWAALGDVEFD